MKSGHLSAYPVVEDVLELDGDYLGQFGSSRRREWDASLERSLAAFCPPEEGGEGG